LLAHAQADAAKAAKGGENTGPRLRKVVLFVIGGITRSELRAVYEISKATGEGRHVRHVTPLKRVCVSGTEQGLLTCSSMAGQDVIIGSTSLDTPQEVRCPQFVAGSATGTELTVRLTVGLWCDVQFITHLSALSQADAMEL